MDRPSGRRSGFRGVCAQWTPAVSRVRGADTVRSRREIKGSPAHDPIQRSPAPAANASLAAAAGQSQSPNGAPAEAGSAPRDSKSPRSTRLAAHPERKAPRYALKNWRVRPRLLLLVVLPTLSAVILGGVAVAASVRSAAAYQRVEQFSRLGGEITGLVQALQAEREDTIRYITLGPPGGGPGAPRARARGGRAAPAARRAPGPEGSWRSSPRMIVPPMCSRSGCGT